MAALTAEKKAESTKQARMAGKSSLKASVRKVQKEQKVSLVIVESPSKAVTISKMLPKEKYKVESCFGHVRDLPSSAKQIPAKYKDEKWSRLGVNVEDSFAPLYVTISGKQKVLRHLRDVLKECEDLVLATDGDREGEAIAWHLSEILKPKGQVWRAVFTEITPTAISRSFQSLRELDHDLIKAQEARRIVDRLAGYTVSPILWTSIAPKLSAGRVQSVALSLIVNREKERLRFKPSEFWEAQVLLSKAGHAFNSRLTAVGERQVAKKKDFDPATGALKESIKSSVVILKRDSILDLFSEARREGHEVQVEAVRKSPLTRKPPQPLITSTLQQEAFTKLRLAVGHTMRIAQGLYEKGLITYMRTDSPKLSKEARSVCIETITSRYGREYVGESIEAVARSSAQEAHEAIRPAGETYIDPENSGLEAPELSVYELIYRRTLASQMSVARLKRTSVDVSCGALKIRSSGSTVVFPGFLRVYEDSSPDGETSDENSTDTSILPDLDAGDCLELIDASPVEHHTQPPPRFNDGSLVKELDRLQIGRPSTYVPTIETLVSRGYAQRTKSRAIAPNLVSFAVNTLLSTYFPLLVSTEFTAEMEKMLDKIAGGAMDRNNYLKTYYLGDEGLKSIVERSKSDIDRSIVRRVDIPKMIDGKEAAADLPNVMVGPYGPYLELDGRVLANLPKETLADEVLPDSIGSIIERAKNPVVGVHTDGNEILYKSGRYGPYFQLGRDDDVREPGTKPKRVRPLPGMDVRNFDIAVVQKLFSLPRTIGVHPRKKLEVIGHIGRFGPYVFCDGLYINLKSWEKLFDLKLEEAVQLIDEKVEKQEQRKKARQKKQAIKQEKEVNNSKSKPSQEENALQENIL